MEKVRQAAVRLIGQKWEEKGAIGINKFDLVWIIIYYEII